MQHTFAHHVYTNVEDADPEINTSYVVSILRQKEIMYICTCIYVCTYIVCIYT